MNYNNFSKSPIRPRSRAAYLFFRFRIATIKLAVARITMNSSYVLISIILPVKTQDGWHARPPGCPGKYIILSRWRPCGGAKDLINTFLYIPYRSYLQVPLWFFRFPDPWPLWSDLRSEYHHNAGLWCTGIRHEMVENLVL